VTDIRHSAPAERNRQFILDVLTPALPATGRILEIASGTGQHVTFFAAALPHLGWQPSDPDPDARASITARIQSEGLTNVSTPLNLDLLEEWPPLQVDAVITANLLHISEPEVLPALMAKAGGLLNSGALLHIYGPFKVAGAFTSESNAAFDASLKARNPHWGIRDMEAVTAEAIACGFSEPQVLDMPANNFSLSFRMS
jgi:cyclopropane fatty-acyl-phospholipid synthase-like methyltransferase